MPASTLILFLYTTRQCYCDIPETDNGHFQIQGWTGPLQKCRLERVNIVRMTWSFLTNPRRVYSDGYHDNLLARSTLLSPK